MFLRFACLAACVLMPVPPRRIPANRNAAVLAALNGRYAAMSRDFIHGNVAALANFMAPGYRFKQGKASPLLRKQVLAMLKGEAGALKVISWKRTITQLNVTKSTATATVSGVLVALRRGAAGKSARFELTAVSHDTWQKGRGGWLLQTTSVENSGLTMPHASPHKGH